MKQLPALLQQLRATYIEGLPGRRARLDAAVQALAQQDTRAEGLLEIERCAHSVAGTAGLFGFHALGETARALELAVGDAGAAASPSQQLMARVTALRSELDAALRAQAPAEAQA
jgi:HPt (histidine-containing phosphotransfer) domain-containing protein